MHGDHITAFLSFEPSCSTLSAGLLFLMLSATAANSLLTFLMQGPLPLLLLSRLQFCLTANKESLGLLSYLSYSVVGPLAPCQDHGEVLECYSIWPPQPHWDWFSGCCTVLCVCFSEGLTAELEC